MMSRIQEELPALFALAHDRSEGGRLQLAGRLANLFLAEDVRLNEREERLVNELLDQLLKINNPVLRRELVRKFADASRMPRSVAVGLANEAIDIARFVLKTNQNLSDDDLISVVKKQSRDHAAAVASRRSVNEAVADALIATGDVQVMQIVAENLGAKLSSKAMEVLVEAGRMTVALHRPIMRRPELTSEAASRLYWLVSRDLRAYCLERFGMIANQMELSLSAAIDEKLSQHLFEKDEDSALNNLVAWLDERHAITPRLLPQVLRQGHFALFNHLLARLAKLDQRLVDAIVAETGGRMLAAVCRALNVDKPSFVSIFLLSRGARADEQIVHPRELSHALAAFDRLQPAMAQELLHNWRKNPDYLLKRTESGLDLDA